MECKNDENEIGGFMALKEYRASLFDDPLDMAHNCIIAIDLKNEYEKEMKKFFEIISNTIECAANDKENLKTSQITAQIETIYQFLISLESENCEFKKLFKHVQFESGLDSANLLNKLIEAIVSTIMDFLTGEECPDSFANSTLWLYTKYPNVLEKFEKCCEIENRLCVKLQNCKNEQFSKKLLQFVDEILTNKSIGYLLENPKNFDILVNVFFAAKYEIPDTVYILLGIVVKLVRFLCDKASKSEHNTHSRISIVESIKTQKIIQKLGERFSAMNAQDISEFKPHEMNQLHHLLKTFLTLDPEPSCYMFLSSMTDFLEISIKAFDVTSLMEKIFCLSIIDQMMIFEPIRHQMSTDLVLDFCSILIAADPDKIVQANTKFSESDSHTYKVYEHCILKCLKVVHSIKSDQNLSSKVSDNRSLIHGLLTLKMDPKRNFNLERIVKSCKSILNKNYP